MKQVIVYSDDFFISFFFQMAFDTPTQKRFFSFFHSKLDVVKLNTLTINCIFVIKLISLVIKGGII